LSDPLAPFEPPAPSPRPASSLAALVLLVVVFVVGIAVGQSGLLGGARAPTGPGVPTPAPSASPGLAGMDLFWKALQVIRENYVGRGQLDDQTLVYGAIRGMVEALGDTGHSVFLTPQEVKDLQGSLDRSVVGIGVLLGQHDGQPVVVSVIPESPAHDAGVRAGDELVSVDGQTVVGLTTDVIVTRIRGAAGTTVQVTLHRPSSGETLDVSIVREQLHVPAAWWAMVPGTKIGLLRLASFGTGASADLQASREAAIAAGATSLILDLRGNPGGYVEEAIRVASLFLHDKTVYVRELASGERIPVATEGEVPSTDLPLVVLVDQYTASAAEIVAGAIQSAHRATLVGATTFGTGTVLNAFDLPDGSAIRLAVERWLTPDGVLIFGKGITPEVAVAMGPDNVPLEPDELEGMSPAQVAALNDPQLLKALELLGAPLPSPAPSAPASPSP
jgi:carboxyl-terminal processing protease